ncbi:hypothetical protein ACJA25_01320 [Mycoplasmopsis hyopharyngis]|uniref:hypothetical protein n=1 Tax=Mycoplasmopsis hyopharyngis TaxID=29558 RepID=UPI0038733725
MNKQKYLFLTSLASLSIATLITPSCASLKKSIENEVPKKWDTYSLLDEKIIFNQDNSPKDITIKSVENEFYKNVIDFDYVLESRIISFYTKNTLPFDFREKEEIEQSSTKEESNYNRLRVCHPIARERKPKEVFKRFTGHKNNFLFDFHTNIFLGQKSSFVNEYQTKMVPQLPKLDYEDKKFFYDDIYHFDHHENSKLIAELSKDTKKYLFFTGTNLHSPFVIDDENGKKIRFKTFYWLPYIKENKIHFVRTIRNNIFVSDILKRKSRNNIRDVMMETNIFDIEKLAKKLNLPANEEFDVQKHVVVENDVYFRNFSDSYRQNMIMTKYDLIDKIGTTNSRKRTIRKMIEKINRKDNDLFSWQFEYDGYDTWC